MTASQTKSVLARQSHGQFQLTLTLPAQEIKSHYQTLLKQAAKEMEIPGFRKGKAPLKKVADQVDQSKLYEQILQHLLPSAYLAAVKEHHIQPIIDPQVELLNTQPDQDWQIRATAAEKPPVKLGDYQTQLKGLLKTANIWTPKSESAPKKDTGENPKHTPNSPTQETTPDDLKSQQAQKITDWLLNNVEVEPSQIMIEHHANQLLAQLLDQVQKLGITLDQYLTSTNKKVEDLKAEYAQRARQNLRLEFIILAIGETEKITVNDQEITDLINQTSDPKIKEELQKPQQKHQLYNIIFRQKVLDHLFKLAA